MDLRELVQEMLFQCKTLNLLYVEDDESISTIMIKMLKPYFHSITIAHDGEEGLNLYSNGSYDIVLTDNVMPKLSGIAMSEKIRIIHPRQVIMIMSSFEEPDHFKDFITVGINKFIPKTAKIEDILKAFIDEAININNAKEVVRLTKALNKDVKEESSL
jgi:DNA-binding NtrC family response regulator